MMMAPMTRRVGRSMPVWLTAVMAWLIAFMALFSAASGMSAAGASDPVVLQTQVAGPVSVGRESAPPALATLHLPKGAWLAWAEVRVAYHGNTFRRVTCWLDRVSLPSTDVQRGTATLGEGPDDERSYALSITTSIGAASGADIEVKCRADLAGSTAHGIRLVAMRVGQLTRVSLPSGSEATTGSGIPRVLQATLPGTVDVPKAATPQLIARLPLPRGRWWLHVTMTIETAAPPTSGADVDCRLVVGTAADTVAGGAVVSPDDDRVMISLDAAADIDHAASARLRCDQEDAPGIPDLWARGIKITAVQVGRLTVADAVAGGASTTTGMGPPVVVHGHRVGQMLLPIPSDTWSTVAQMAVPEGRWLLVGKVVPTLAIGLAPMQCRLRLGHIIDKAVEYRAQGVGVPFLMVTPAGGAGTARLECREPGAFGDEPGGLKEARLTAVRIT